MEFAYTDDEGIWAFSREEDAVREAADPKTIVFQADIKDVWPELKGVEL